MKSRLTLTVNGLGEYEPNSDDTLDETFGAFVLDACDDVDDDGDGSSNG